MYTPKGRREFVPRDQVFPLFSVYSLLLLPNEISSFMPVLTIGIVRDCFNLHIFYSEKFSTWVWRLPFAVNMNLNLSITGLQAYVPSSTVSKMSREQYPSSAMLLSTKAFTVMKCRNYPKHTLSWYTFTQEPLQYRKFKTAQISSTWAFSLRVLTYLQSDSRWYLWTLYIIYEYPAVQTRRFHICYAQLAFMAIRN